MKRHIEKHGIITIILIAFFIAIINFQVTSAKSAKDVDVIIDGRQITFDVPAQIIKDRTMVPLSRIIEEITGTPAEWDGNLKKVTFRVNGDTNWHIIGQNIVYKNNEPILFDTPSCIINSRTLVPLRMIAETSGYKVEWDGVNYKVIITKQADINPKIVSVSPDRSIKKGEAATIRVITNEQTHSVALEVNNRSIHGELQTIDQVTKNKTWSLEVYPEYTQNIKVNAKSLNTDSIDNKTINIEVVSGEASIDEIKFRDSTIYNGDYTEIEIITNQDTEYVWVEYNNTTKDATYEYIKHEDKKVWYISIIPSESQTVRVYANATERNRNNSASESKYINVIDESEEIIIQEMRMDRREINEGDELYIYIVTSGGVENVWTEVDGKTISASLKSNTKNNKTWDLRVTPKESTSIIVYANDRLSIRGADATSEYIIVNTDKSADIKGMSSTSDIITAGRSIQISVTTNEHTDEVWAELTSGSDTWRATKEYSNEDSISWVIECYPTSSGVIKIHAKSEYNQEVDTRSINVTVRDTE